MSLRVLVVYSVIVFELCRADVETHCQRVGLSLAGHAEIDMTEHYLHVQSGVKTAAVESLAQLIGA